MSQLFAAATILSILFLGVVIFTFPEANSVPWPDLPQKSE